jgi:hypothetical protein
VSRQRPGTRCFPVTMHQRFSTHTRSTGALQKPRHKARTMEEADVSFGSKAERPGLSTMGPLYTRQQTSLPNRFTSALRQKRSCGHLHKFEEGRKLLARSVSPNHHHRRAGLRRPMKRGAHVALQASAATDVRREQNEIAPNVEDHGADQRSPRWVYRRSPVLSS